MSKPIPLGFQVMMKAIGESLNVLLNAPDRLAVIGEREIGFVVLTFDAERLADGWVNYLGNVDRPVAIEALKAWIAKQEAAPPEPPALVQ